MLVTVVYNTHILQGNWINLWSEIREKNGIRGQKRFRPFNSTYLSVYIQKHDGCKYCSKNMWNKWNDLTTQCVRKAHMDAEVQHNVSVSAPQWAAEHVLVAALITVLSSLPSHRNCFHCFCFSKPFPWNPPLLPTLLFSFPSLPHTTFLVLFFFISSKVLKLSTRA